MDNQSSMFFNSSYTVPLAAGKTTTKPHTTSSSTSAIRGPIFISVFAQSDFMYVYLVSQLLLGLISMSLNSIVFSFYWGHVSGGSRNRKRNRVYYFLYVMLSLADLLRGLTALFHALVLGFVIHYTPHVVEPLCYLILILTSISGHLSILLNVLISLLRTVQIVSPTLQIGTGPLIIPIVLYLVLWGAISAYDVYLLEGTYLAGKAEHTMLYVLIAPRIYSLFDTYDQQDDKKWIEYAMIAIGLPYILPTIICFACSCVQIAYLLNMNVRSSANARITATIFVLTACFFLCNIPYFLFFCLSINQWTEEGFIGNAQTIPSYFVANFPSTIHSILNPSILLSRGRTLRKHFLSAVPFVRSMFSERLHTTGRSHLDSQMTSRAGAEIRSAPCELPKCREADAVTSFHAPQSGIPAPARVSVNLENGTKVRILVD